MSNFTTYIMAIICLIAGFAVGSVALPVPESTDTGAVSAPSDNAMIAMAERIQQLEADFYNK